MVMTYITTAEQQKIAHLGGTRMTTAVEIVGALGGRKGHCRCPAHDDRTPSPR